MDQAEKLLQLSRDAASKHGAESQRDYYLFSFSFNYLLEAE